MNTGNRWQYAKQIEYQLRTVRWPDAPAGLVLGWAATSDLPVEAVYAVETVPFALVRTGGAEPGPEVAGFATSAQFEIELVTEGRVDMEGSSSIVGGGRNNASGGLTHQGSSEGRGLLEIEEMCRRALTSYDLSAGMLSSCEITAAGVTTIMPDGFVASVTKLSVTVFGVTRDRYYPSPVVKTATGGVGGVTLGWALPTRRWDALGGASPKLRIYYQTGAVAPAYGSGTLYTPADGSVAATVPTGAGTWSFTIFSLYDETGNGVNERQSGAVPVAQATSITAT